MTDTSPPPDLRAPAARPRLSDRLARPVQAQSLAVFRMAFGALLVWDCIRFVRYDRVWRYWVQPDLHFTYPFFGWVTPLPEPWINIAWGAMGLCAALVAVGLFYRVAIVALTVLFTYFFLIDAAEYLNHFYLVILFAMLLCVIPAHRVWSLDARRRPPPTPTVPYAAVFILRAQMEVMLVFAGLVKLTPDWLAGEPLGLWLRDHGGVLAPLYASDGFIVAAAWGTIVLHVAGAPLLLWHRTRLATFAVYCVFHVANAVHFNIGIFPWLTIAATTIFFAPGWPGALLARLRGSAAPVALPSTVSLPSWVAGPRTLPRAVLVAMALWLGVQITLPLRAAAFATEVRWAGDGHRFSWRMRIYDRQAYGLFTVTAGDGTAWIVDPADWLTDRQVSKMLVRSDLVHGFAAHLDRAWQAAGYGDVVVQADIMKSLNGRPYQPFVDPLVDLTSVRVNLWGADPWVLPLQGAVWGVARNG